MQNDMVRHAMTPSPATIQADATVVDAARLMAAENIGSLPVVTGEDLVGIVTDRDLVLQVLARDADPHKVTIASVCSAASVVVAPDDPLDVALTRMAVGKVRRLPVVEDDRLVGILAQADISRNVTPAATGRMVEEISQS